MSAGERLGRCRSLRSVATSVRRTSLTRLRISGVVSGLQLGTEENGQKQWSDSVPHTKAIGTYCRGLSCRTAPGSLRDPSLPARAKTPAELRGKPRFPASGGSVPKYRMLVPH
jgi:hypothetical protein